MLTPLVSANIGCSLTRVSPSDKIDPQYRSSIEAHSPDLSLHLILQGPTSLI